MSQPYNLDDGVSEYFEFILKGNTYRFRYPTTNEMKEITDSKEDKDVVKNLLSKFITKADEKSPDFEKIVDEMTVPNWTLFNKMITQEMNPNAKSNTGQETT